MFPRTNFHEGGTNPFSFESNPKRFETEQEKQLKSQIQELNSTVSLLKADQENLNNQIQNLNSTVSFLRSSLDNPLMSPPPFPDVVLVASDDPSAKPIPANRSILASRSPVFRAMLEAEMEESISKTINIREVSYDTLGVFVTFLYTAEASLDEKMACDILVLGDKYQILHLKTYCEKFLISKLNWENSLPFYAFACQHNAHSLAVESLSLISVDMKKLSQREDYAQFVEKDPRMLLQIYEAYPFYC